MKLHPFVILLFVCISLISGAQPAADQIAEFSNHGEVYLKLNPDVAIWKQSLPAWISVDGFDGDGWILAYAPEKELTGSINEKIMKDAMLLPHPSTLYDPVMKDVGELKETDDWDYYPTYDAYLDLMYGFQENYPALCQVLDFGETNEGRDLLAAVITGGEPNQGQKPRVLFTSSIHGDEITGYVLFLRLIDHLLSNYDTDPKIHELLDNTEIWINPLANPDGTYAGGDNTVSGAKRFNANNVDLNRNYPDPEDGQHPDGKAWQTETLGFMGLADEYQFVLGVNCHGGSEVFNYPWDTWPQLPADDDWWNLVAREWVDTVYQYGPPGYFEGFDDGVSNGYQWYSIDGGRQDYMNYFHHCREYTLEISNTKLPPADQLPDYWEYNYRSFLNYIRQAGYGIRGRVRDASTGDPLEAIMFVEGHDIDNSWVASNQEGWYFRPLYEGTYDISFFAPAYEEYVALNVDIGNFEQLLLDVNLNYTGSGIGENNLGDVFTVGNNPGPGSFLLNYEGREPLDVSMTVCNAGGVEIMNSALNFSADNNSITIGLEAFRPGIYFLHLRSGARTEAFKLLIQ